MPEAPRVCSKCGKSYAADVIFCPQDGTPLGGIKTDISDDPYLDLTVQGQFRIEQLIGIGAMGRVYRAHQKGIDREVAIKVLHRELLRNPTVIARFHREAKVASRLTHPNVVQVLMTGELERVSADIGGEAYLVMEYLDGISLRSALAASGGALPLPRSLHVILQVCDAVGEAHAQGIVHRDLKPENVMLVRRGDDKDFAKVLDFGVARIEWADSTVATQAGAIFGTARYISPEGAQGEKVGPPSDVYSIATMLFQCLAGQTPFDGESPVAILVKQTSEQPPNVRSVSRASYVPEPISQVIAKNLAKDARERCSDARELGRAIVEAARSSGLSPDDLVVRSTLLGSAGTALQLQSIQRTRALALTPDLASKLKGTAPGGAGQTALLDAPDAEEPAQPPATAEPEARPPTSSSPDGTCSEAARAASPSRADAAPSPQPAPSAARASSPDAERQSTVEPTLADEPADEVVRASVPPSTSAAGEPAEGARSSVASIPPGTYSESRPSFPDSDWEPPVDDVAARTRTIATVVICFVFGATLAIAVALKLGVFEQREPTVSWYAERANAALAASAWDTPPGENVREITDAALQRWPKEQRILEVRRRAARALTRQAESLRSEKPADALRLARLAVEFEPDNARARSLLVALSAPTEVVEDLPDDAPTLAADAAASKSADKRPRALRRRKAPVGKPEPAKQPPPAGGTDAGTAPAQPKPSREGRWL